MDTTTHAIQVNGEARDVPAGLTLHALLTHLGRDPEQGGVAVALDDRVVRRALWPETPLAPSSRVEIITASQGG